VLEAMLTVGSIAIVSVLIADRMEYWILECLSHYASDMKPAHQKQFVKGDRDAG
jgi:hypothetical protein